MTRQEALDQSALEIMRWRREKQFRDTKLKHAQMEYEDAEANLEMAILNYNQVLNANTGSESKTENQTAT